MLSPGKKRREMDNTYEIDETKLSASSYKRQCNSENKNNTLVNQITFDTLSKLLTEDKQTWIITEHPKFTKDNSQKMSLIKIEANCVCKQK